MGLAFGLVTGQLIVTLIRNNGNREKRAVSIIWCGLLVVVLFGLATH
jgi:high-affinity Fe2+/Pb2+ permease